MQTIKNDKPQDLEQALGIIFTDTPDRAVRIYRSDEVAVGAVIHQGDVYLHRVADDHPHGKVLGTRKLAIGQGEGSNHMAEGEDVEVFAGTSLPPTMKVPSAVAALLIGPVVVARESWRNSHTTHADHVLPAGTYQVTYQLDMLTQTRVQD